MSVSLWSPPDITSPSSFDVASIEVRFVEDQTELVSSQNVWSLSAEKRAFDFTVALSATIALLPVFAAIAVAVKLDSRGRALFRQTRIGKDQIPFTIYKFRTMRTQSETEGPSVTRKDDCRMTKTGLWLRKFKLDELPQLLNVIRGDMSLVGPRPKLMGHEKMDLVCRPGVTGVATLTFANEEDLLMEVAAEDVESFTIEVLNPIKAELDAQYVKEGCFGSDISLLFRTAFGLGRHKAISSIPELVEVSQSMASSRQSSR